MYTTISPQKSGSRGKGNIYAFVYAYIKQLWKETQKNSDVWLPIGRGNEGLEEAPLPFPFVSLCSLFFFFNRVNVLLMQNCPCP